MCRLAGTKPAPMPWSGCGLGSPPLMTARLGGLDRERPEIREALLEPLADARDVAAGADARDQEVDPVREVAQDLRSSRARWISGLAGFSNCCGIHAPSIWETSSSARAIAPFIPSSRGVSSSSAP